MAMGTSGSWSGRVHYMALAGSTLKATSGSFLMPSTGNVTVSGVTLNPAHPTLLICYSTFRNGGATDGIFSIGFTSGPGTDRASLLFVPYNSWGFQTAPNNTLIESGAGRAQLVSFNSGSFTLSQDIPRGQTYTVGYLLLNDVGGNFNVSNYAWPTASGSRSIGFQPQGVLFHGTRNGAETSGGSVTLGALGETVAQSIVFGGNNVTGAGQPRIWTAMDSDLDALLDYTGSAGTLLAEFTPGPITSTGYSTNGYSLGGTRSAVAAAAMRTSAPAAPDLCAPPQIWRYA